MADEENTARKKTCVDDLPHDVKPVIIGAIDLCGKVSTFIECVMRKDVSDKQACSKAYDVHVSACKLYKHLHNAFTWEDISKILEDLRADDGKEEETAISIKEGEIK
jgi:hypothetical protein